MRVNGNYGQQVSASSRAQSAPREAASDETRKSDQSTSNSRALIPLSPAASSARPHTTMRQPANFLAHLIATEQAAPQTRERRRLEPELATAAYCAVRALAPEPSAHALSRAM
jgi:hypothetical protein